MLAATMLEYRSAEFTVIVIPLFSKKKWSTISLLAAALLRFRYAKTREQHDRHVVHVDSVVTSV